jgi:hypothetical protein
MKNKNLTRILYFVGVACFTSCDVSYFDKEMEGSEINLELPVPIGTSEYTIDRMFDDLEFQDVETDANGNLMISYTEKIEGGDNAAFNVEVEDINVNSLIPLPTQITDNFIGGSFTVPAIGEQDLDTDGEEIKEINLSQKITKAVFDQGTLEITLQSDYDSEVEMTLTIPSLRDKSNNEAYTVTKTFSNTSVTIDLELKDYDAYFSHDGTELDKTYNTFVVKYTTKLKLREGDVLNDTDELSFDVNINNAGTPEIIYGDFLKESFDVSNQTISLDFFEDFGNGGISFADASMTLTAKSKYGFPIGLDLSGIEATNNTGGSVQLEKNDGNLVIFDGVAPNDYPTVTVVETSLELTKENSNINELLSSKPNEINLSVNGSANPEHIEGEPNFNFFAKASQGFDIDLDIQVPLNVKFDNIEFTETFEFDVDEISEELKNLSLKIATENGIPLTGAIDLVFKRANGSVVDGILVESNIIAFKAAPVDAEGKSNGTETNVTEFNITNIEALNEVAEIDLVISLNSTEGANSVVLNKSNRVTATLSAKASATVNLDSDNE